MDNALRNAPLWHLNLVGETSDVKVISSRSMSVMRSENDLVPRMAIMTDFLLWSRVIMNAGSYTEFENDEYKISDSGRPVIFSTADELQKQQSP